MTAVEFLSEFRVSPDDLVDLPPVVKGAIAIACGAVTESHILLRLYLAACHDFIDQEPIDVAVTLQRSLLLRTWSVKLFEFHKFFSSSNSKVNKDDQLAELVKIADEGFEELKNHSAYPLVRSLRDEAQNHYDVDAAGKNFEHVGKHANFSMYMHERNGNSFYPMGDEVLFIARVNRASNAAGDRKKIQKLHSDWMDWNLAAHAWLSKSHYRILVKFIIERLPDRVGYKKMYWIPDSMVSDAKVSKLPVFFRM